MRSLASRIERYERTKPSCRRCGGKGKSVVIELDEFEPVPTVDPTMGCMVCGKVDLVTIRWVNEPAVPGGTVPKELLGRTVPKGLFH